MLLYITINKRDAYDVHCLLKVTYTLVYFQKASVFDK